MNIIKTAVAPLGLEVWSETTLVALLLMELTWVTTWYNAFYSWRSNWGLVFLLFGAILFLSHYLARQFETWNLRQTIRQIFYGLWVLFCLLASLKILVYPHEPVTLLDLFVRPFLAVSPGGTDQGEFWHLIIVILVIFRGVFLARNPIITVDIRRSFMFGLLMFLVYGLVFTNFAPNLTILAFSIYLIASLLAMSSGRIASVSELRGGRLPKMNSLWLAGLFLISILIVTLAALFGNLLQGVAAQAFASLVILLFELIVILILLLLLPFFYLLIQAIPWLQSLIKIKGLNDILDTMANATKLQLAESTTQVSKNVDLLAQMKPFALLAILVGVFIVILIALKWRSWKILFQQEENSTSLAVSPNFNLKPFLKNLGQRLNLIRTGQILAAARIRRIYAQLMLLSAKLGVPRPPALTPLEFLPRLERLFPDESAQLTLITNAYLTIRYGELPENIQEVNAVISAWDQIRKKGSMKLKEIKRPQKVVR